MDPSLRSLRLFAIPLLATGALMFSASVRAAESPAGTITLRDALDATLRTNPDLAAAALDVRANDARTAQARLLPNPTFSAEAENLGASAGDGGSEPPQGTLRIAQLVELGGKRAKRIRLAALERDGAQWDYEVRRADVLAETAKRFVTVLSLQERRALAADVARLAQDLQRTVETQVRAGGAAPVDASRARVTLGQSRLMLTDRERELAAARLALAAAWGASAPTFERVTGNLLDMPAPPSGAVVAVEGNPDVARWVTELDVRTAALSLEQARAVPDVSLGAGPRYFFDSDQVAAVVELAVPLPLFDRNQGAIAAASAALAAARERQRAAALAAHAAVGRAAQNLSAAYERAVALRDELVPAAASASKAALAAYRSGAVRYLEVIDAQRSWFELRDQFLGALAAYHLAHIDLDRLTGTEVGGGFHPSSAHARTDTRGN